jgi:hypothetical protein
MTCCWFGQYIFVFLFLTYLLLILNLRHLIIRQTAFRLLVPAVTSLTSWCAMRVPKWYRGTYYWHTCVMSPSVRQRLECNHFNRSNQCFMSEMKSCCVSATCPGRVTGTAHWLWRHLHICSCCVLAILGKVKLRSEHHICHWQSWAAALSYKHKLTWYWLSSGKWCVNDIQADELVHKFSKLSFDIILSPIPRIPVSSLASNLRNIIGLLRTTLIILLSIQIMTEKREWKDWGGGGGSVRVQQWSSSK